MFSCITSFLFLSSFSAIYKNCSLFRDSRSCLQGTTTCFDMHQFFALFLFIFHTIFLVLNFPCSNTISLSPFPFFLFSLSLSSSNTISSLSLSLFSSSLSSPFMIFLLLRCFRPWQFSKDWISSLEHFSFSYFSSFSLWECVTHFVNIFERPEIGPNTHGNWQKMRKGPFRK